MKIIFTPAICTVTLILLISNVFGHGGGEAEIEIGPNKGVTQVTPDKSFKLSPEAMKSFGIKSISVAGGAIPLPKEAIVHTLKNSQIFRIRDGFLKAVSFKTQSKSDRIWTILSGELQPKDEVVTGGVGFLRIIASQLGEVEAEEEEHGHREKAGHAHESEEGEHHD